jgi:FkbM family methyltransferase
MIANYNSKTVFGRIKFLIFSFFRNVLIRLSDPTCQLEVRGKQLFMPLSHNLPYYMAQFPNYDGLLERLADFIRQKYARLIYIDVGSNIGDTINFCYKNSVDIFLGLEANDIYFEYCKKNVKFLKNVKLLKAICSESDGIANWTTKRIDGTARIIKDPQTCNIKTSIDSIIEEEIEFDKVNFIKIDTDGHDFNVLKGARKTIAKNKPVVLFESDVFENENYVEEFQEIMQFFFLSGYKSALVYDTFGYLFRRLELNNSLQFKDSLFYQLISTCYHFDILLMKESDLKSFLLSEITFFIDRMPKKYLQRSAKVAAQAYLLPEEVK